MGFSGPTAYRETKMVSVVFFFLFVFLFFSRKFALVAQITPRLRFRAWLCWGQVCVGLGWQSWSRRQFTAGRLLGLLRALAPTAASAHVTFQHLQLKSGLH